MIIDKLAFASRYESLSPNFRRAFRFLADSDLTSFPCGNIPIDGEKVFGSMQEYATRTGPYQYEAHDRYADIQVVLGGRERFALGLDAVMQPPDPGTDFRRCQADTFLDFVLDPEQFVIFLPGEVHAPGNAAEEPARCRKLVIKVLCE